MQVISETKLGNFKLVKLFTSIVKNSWEICKEIFSELFLGNL